MKKVISTVKKQIFPQLSASTNSTGNPLYGFIELQLRARCSLDGIYEQLQAKTCSGSINEIDQNFHHREFFHTEEMYFLGIFRIEICT